MQKRKNIQRALRSSLRKRSSGNQNLKLRKTKSPKKKKVSYSDVWPCVEDDKGSHEKKEQKSSEDDKDQSGWGEKIKGFFFEPNGGPPKPEGWVGALAAAGTLYYIVNHKQPMKEIIYMDFLNNYLTQNRVKSIGITKDNRSEIFNHRAEIEMVDGEKFYMVLGS